MKVKITQNDFEHNRITKIARFVAKIVRPELDLPHAKILLIVSRFLGYSSYFKVKKSAEIYADRESLDEQLSLMDHYAPSTDVIKQAFVAELVNYVNDSSDLEKAFNFVPLRALDFFSESGATQNLTKGIISGAKLKYFSSLKYWTHEGFTFEDEFGFPSLRSDAYMLLRTLPDRLLRKVLLNQKVSEFFLTPVTVTTSVGDEDTEVSGTYAEGVFKPFHDNAVQMSIPYPLLKNKLSSQAFWELNDILMSSFKAAYADLPVISLFQAQRNELGFYGEFGQTGFGCRWVKIKSENVPKYGQFKICKIKAENVWESCTEGNYWKYEEFDENGSVRVVISGGLYFTNQDCDEIVYGGNFPSDQNAAYSREYQLIHRMIENCSGDDLTRTLQGMNLMTVSVLEKKQGTAPGIGINALKTAIDVMRECYGVMSIYVFSAPMQYIDWIPGVDFEIIQKSKKRDVKRLSAYLKRSLKIGLPVTIVKPDH